MRQQVVCLHPFLSTMLRSMFGDRVIRWKRLGTFVISIDFRQRNENFLLLFRVNFALTTANGKIYVLGGEGLKGVIIQTVEAYDPIADRWKEVGMLTKPRRYHAASTINGKLWSCGGASSLLEAQSTDELVFVFKCSFFWISSSTSFLELSIHVQKNGNVHFQRWRFLSHVNNIV